MSDDQGPLDPRISESSRWRAEMFDALQKMHTKVTVLEGRVGAGFGVGDDDGKFGKLTDKVGTLWRGAVFGICRAVVSLGSVIALVYGRGDAAGELRAHIATIERDVDRLGEQLRALWSQRLIAPAPSARPPEPSP